jgi:redox-sensitive bicupin YhaK (pirin superfamily)
VRRSADRGHANHGWLDTYHTFSFAMYSDDDFDGFRTLRVLNEDRVAGHGFPAHPHRNFEIFSYIVSGALEHKDSMNHREVLRRGDVQFTSAGSGIRHSEYNHDPKETVHFLQCWVIPNKNGLEPNYQTAHFSEEDKKGKLCLIIQSKEANEDDGEKKAIQLNQDVRVYASILSKGQQVEHKIESGRAAYVHLVDLPDAKLKINDDVVLSRGDGVFVEDVASLKLEGDGEGQAEFLLFDLA